MTALLDTSPDLREAAPATGYRPVTGLGLAACHLSKTRSGFLYGMWAVPRPLTRTWGSGQVWKRISEAFGTPDAAFGKTDGIPDGVFAVDRKGGYEWAALPFGDGRFAFGYWDPPYDKLYRKECAEIWRCCRALAVLHTMVYPTSYFEGAKRVAGVGITMGPFKAVRLLQVFVKGSGQVGLFERTAEPERIEA